MEMKKRMGDYEILDELGSGGMGRVFRVRSVISDRVEAMKVLLPDLAGRQDLAARFLREIRLLAAMNHPNIAALRTALTVDNQLVMIMEYVEGQSLAARLAHGPIACAEALGYIDQVLDALAYAHGQQIVHRDIKPANMLLTAQGIVKLTDFGIARSRGDQSITMTGTTTGSLSYMAPEQVRGEPTDARSDLYSVGISLYEMVTGRRPFEAESDFAIMMAHVNEPPKPPIQFQPALPLGLNEMILKAISKDPAARFQSADEFRAVLRTVSGIGPARTASRNATVLVTGTSSLPSSVQSPAGASVHARTVLDTKTPTYQPVPPRSQEGVNAPVPSASVRAGHPFAYVALGGVLVIIALVGAGLYLGRAEAGPDAVKKAVMKNDAAPAAAAEAGAAAAGTPASAPAVTPASGSNTGIAPAVTSSGAGGTTPAPATTAVPSQPPGPTGPAGSGAPGAAPASALNPSSVPPPPSRPEPKPALVPSRKPTSEAKPRLTAVDAPAPATRPSAGEAGASTAEPKAQERTPDPAALDQLEADVDQLTARAGGVNDSLDRLQQEQARQGLGLRGDMAARQQSMNNNLTRAREAIDKKDLAKTEKYRLAAERDIEVLERFLGR